MSDISLRQYASLLASNSVRGMAQTLRLTPPISVRNLVATADTFKGALKDIKDDDENPKNHKDNKDNKDTPDVKELWDPIYGGGGETEARTAMSASNSVDEAANVSGLTGHTARPTTLLTGPPIV